MSHGASADATTEWSIDRVIAAREAAEALLDALELEAYLFEIEPRTADGVWEIRLEWARGGPAGIWTTTTLEIDRSSLLRSREDEPTRARIVSAWREQLMPAG